MGSRTFEAKEAPYLDVQASFHNAFPWERAHRDNLRDLKKPLFIKSSFLTTESSPQLMAAILTAPHGKPWVPEDVCGARWS